LGYVAVSLCYIARPCLKKEKINNKERRFLQKLGIVVPVEAGGLKFEASLGNIASSRLASATQ
jgi:hypothetical protein